MGDLTMPASPRRRRSSGLVLAGVLTLGPLMAACSDDDPEESSTTTAPEDVKAPMEEVLAGLPEILEAGEAADAAAAEGDFDAVLAEYEELHEVWEEVEGTIKDTDRDTYEEIETAQSLIKDGGENEDADRVSTGVADQKTAIDTFIEENG
jgi:hypothetical protein